MGDTRCIWDIICMQRIKIFAEKKYNNWINRSIWNFIISAELSSSGILKNRVNTNKKLSRIQSFCTSRRKKKIQGDIKKELSIYIKHAL
jgi:hypothetical protein